VVRGRLQTPECNGLDTEGVVLVSGGARGQGAAEARLLVAQGAKVVIGDVLDNLGQTLAAELGPAASFVRQDVTSEADWARAVESARKLGGLHGLVRAVVERREI
jgi:3alpha(or 20beta)-hydroxysteroid dehydrogenase